MITKLITITHSNMYVHIIKVHQTAYHICNPVTLVHKPGCLHYGILGGDSSNTLSTKAFLLLVVLAKGCRVSAQVEERERIRKMALSLPHNFAFSCLPRSLGPLI